jgi:hypothetical protein
MNTDVTRGPLLMPASSFSVGIFSNRGFLAIAYTGRMQCEVSLYVAVSTCSIFALLAYLDLTTRPPKLSIGRSTSPILPGLLLGCATVYSIYVSVLLARFGGSSLAVCPIIRSLNRGWHGCGFPSLESSVCVTDSSARMLMPKLATMTQEDIACS